MSQEVVTVEGEIVEGTGLESLGGGSIVAQMATAEISQQIATARRFPRSIVRASKNIQSLVTLDEESAQDCIYALPRGGNPIRGPSIRLAEVVAQSWGNNRVSAQVAHVDKEAMVITAEAVFHDLETNAAVKVSVQRRISDKKGRLLSADMIVVTGNAACSIAKRNAILGGVPKAIWNKAYLAAEGVIKGDVKTLGERRTKAIKSFGTWGVKPEQLFAALGVNGEEEVTVDHLPTLFGMYQAIKNGEETVESLFNSRAVVSAKQFDRIPDPLRDDAPADNGAAGGQQQTGAPGATGNADTGKAAGAAQQGAPTDADGKGKPADPTPEGDKAPKADAGKPAAGGEKAPDAGNEPELTPEQRMRKAFEHGEAAAKRDAARKPPRALSEEGRETEKESWFAGYDAARAGMVEEKGGEAA